MSPTASWVLSPLATWRPPEIQTAFKIWWAPRFLPRCGAAESLTDTWHWRSVVRGSSSLQTTGGSLRRRGHYVANGEMSFVAVGDLAPAGLSQLVEQFVGPSPMSDRGTGVKRAFPRKDFPCAGKAMWECGLLTRVQWARGSGS